MAILVPSILEDTPENFYHKLTEILKIPEVQRIQVDISDGKFTPRKTVGVADLDVLNPAYFWEAHLMVENPKGYFLDAKIAGFNCVYFHFEAVADKNQLSVLVEELKKLKLLCGLAVNPDTRIEDILPYAADFDQILLLEVHPGYQGQKEMADAVARLQKLKNTLKNAKIEIDGGVKSDNIKELVRAGADYLVINSALFDPGSDGSFTPTQNFEKLSVETQSL